MFLDGVEVENSVMVLDGTQEEVEEKSPDGAKMDDVAETVPFKGTNTDDEVEEFALFITEGMKDDVVDKPPIIV